MAYEKVYTLPSFLLSVEAEGGMALVTLAGEVSYQLTIADHQKQTTTYGRDGEKSRALKRN